MKKIGYVLIAIAFLAASLVAVVEVRTWSWSYFAPLAILGFVAHLLDFRATAWLFERLATVWVILFIILFQPELRRILLYIGQNPLLRWISKSDNSKTEEIIHSAFELKKAGLGALIVVIRDAGLKSIVERGVQVNAVINHDLILSIFNTSSPFSYSI